MGGRNLGERVGEGIEFAIGWLIGFPVVMGLTFGSVAWLFGQDFASWALFWGGLMFLFALFAGASSWGFGCCSPCGPSQSSSLPSSPP